MYPFKEGSLYPHEHWYVAAWSHEVSRQPLARHILNEPVVLYRTERGGPVAMVDRCPHRRYPLSKGKLVGDAIQCGYHGFTFNKAGTCIQIPSQETVPPSYAVQTFPVAERGNWIWIWTGDPAKADTSLLPDHYEMRVTDPGWTAAPIERVTVRARHALLHDNLLDLTHVSYLHDGSIGSSGVARTKLEMDETDRGFEVRRFIKSDTVEHLPLAKAIGVNGLADRIMIQRFYAPSLHVTGSIFISAAEGGIDPGREFGGFRVLHGITPETPTTTHYFFGFSRDFRQNDAGFTQTMTDVLKMALVEDVEASELIEDRLGSDGSRVPEEIHARADRPALKGRMLIQSMMDAEAGKVATAA